MAESLRYRERLTRQLPRVRKLLKQGLRVATSGCRPTTRVVLVAGSQPSASSTDGIATPV